MLFASSIISRYRFGPGATPTPPTPPSPGQGVNTTTFVGFGGGFLGPYYKRKRPKEECFVTPPAFVFDKAGLFPKWPFIAGAPTPVIQGAVPCAKPIYQARMTPRMRELLNETPEQTRKRKVKKRREEEEIILRIL